MSGPCGACVRPVHDVGVLCSACTGRLRRDLLDVPGLLAELDTTALRQAKTGDGGGSGDAPPWDERARRAQHALRNAITTWCRVLLDDCTRLTHPAETIPALWLAEQTAHIRLQPWAPDMAADIRRTTAASWRTIDQPEDRLYAGPCTVRVDGTECGRPLWARVGQAEVTCPGCGWRWPVVERQEWLMRSAADLHETARVIASALTLMTRTRVSASNVRNWASEGRLAPTGTRGASRLYRVGDVLSLVEARNERAIDAPHGRRELTPLLTWDDTA